LHFFSKKVINVALLTCMMYVPMFYINKSNYFNYNNTNRVAHRVTHGHRLMPMPDPQLIGLPMGRAHGRTSRPIPYPFGSGAHGRTCPWVKLPGLDPGPTCSFGERFGSRGQTYAPFSGETHLDKLSTRDPGVNLGQLCVGRT
jgi:hypothetical protein